MTNWGDLPNELKWMIVDRMDIITRFRLKMCSKSDKCLVETVPFYCDEVTAVPNVAREQRTFLELCIEDVTVCWDERTTTLAIRREDKKQRYKPPSEKKERFIKLSSAEEGPEMIKCMFIAFMLPQNARIRRFYTSMDLTYLFFEHDIKLHVKQLQLAVNNRTDNKAWLDVLAKLPDKLYIMHGWNGIESHPMVQNVDDLYLADPRDVGNEHLSNFKATSLFINSFKITEKGINEYIKKLINDDYPIGSALQFLIYVPSEWDSIIDGLDYKIFRTPKEESDDDSDDDWIDEEDEEEEEADDDNIENNGDEDMEQAVDVDNNIEDGNIEDIEEADADNNAEVDMDEDMESLDDDNDNRYISGTTEARVNMSPQKDIIVELYKNPDRFSNDSVYIKVVKKGEFFI